MIIPYKSLQPIGLCLPTKIYHHFWLLFHFDSFCVVRWSQLGWPTINCISISTHTILLHSISKQRLGCHGNSAHIHIQLTKTIPKSLVKTEQQSCHSQSTTISQKYWNLAHYNNYSSSVPAILTGKEGRTINDYIKKISPGKESTWYPPPLGGKLIQVYMNRSP